MSVRMYILATLVQGMALALLAHLGSVWIYHEFMIGEPNVIILAIETVSIFSIMCFSLYCIFQMVSGSHNK